MEASSQAFWNRGSDHSPNGAWAKKGTSSKMLCGAGVGISEGLGVDDIDGLIEGRDVFAGVALGE